MTSPFRHRKKERRRLRAIAKKDIAMAEKFERAGTKCKSDLAAGSRRMAELFTGMALAKRRKKKPKLRHKTTSKLTVELR
jgi:hypothetical protein